MGLVVFWLGCAAAQHNVWFARLLLWNRPVTHDRPLACCRFGSFLGALLVAQIGYVGSLWILVGICVIFIPVGIFGMDR